MKTTLLSATLVLASVAPTSGFAATTSFPLICRGGSESISGVVDLLYSPSSNPSVSPVVGHATISFTKSARAAGQSGQGLNPGECSWMDRPLNATEPAVFVDGQASLYIQNAIVFGNSNVLISATDYQGILGKQQNTYIQVFVMDLGGPTLTRDTSHPVQSFTR